MTKRLLIVGFLILSVLVLSCGPTAGPRDADGASSDSAEAQPTPTYTPWPTKPTSTPAPDLATKPPLHTPAHEPPPEHSGGWRGARHCPYSVPPARLSIYPSVGRSYAKISTPRAPTRTLTTTSSPAPKTSCPGTPPRRSGSVGPSVRPSVLGIQDWRWVGSTVQVGQRLGTVEIGVGDHRLAVHPRAQSAGQRFILPGQWEGLSKPDVRPQQEPLAVQVPVGEVERRTLDVYELVAGGAR